MEIVCKKGNMPAIIEEVFDQMESVESAFAFCSICNNPYCATSAATLLPCGHSLCLTCASRMLENAKANGQSAVCPFCQKKFYDAPKNYAIMDVIDAINRGKVHNKDDIKCTDCNYSRCPGRMQMCASCEPDKKVDNFHKAEDKAKDIQITGRLVCSDCVIVHHKTHAYSSFEIFKNISRTEEILAKTCDIGMTDNHTQCHIKKYVEILSNRLSAMKMIENPFVNRKEYENLNKEHAEVLKSVKVLDSAHSALEKKLQELYNKFPQVVEKEETETVEYKDTFLDRHPKAAMVGGLFVALGLRLIGI